MATFLQSAVIDPAEILSAVDKLARSIETNSRLLDEHARQMKQFRGGGGGGGGGGGFPSLPSRGTVGGGFGGGSAAAGAAAFVAALKAGELAIRGITSTGEILQNSTLTTAQKMDKLGAQLPVVGRLVETFQDLRNMVLGTSEALRQNARRSQDARARGGLEQDALVRQRGMETELAQAVNRRRGTEAFRVADLPSFDRTTLAGEQAYRDSQHLLQSQDEAARARRDSEIARQNAQIRVGNLDENRYEIARLEVRRNDARQARTEAVNRENYTGVRDQAGIDRASRELEEAERRLGRAIQDRTNLQEQAARSAIDAAQAESAARRANIGVLQQELEVLRQREQRITANAERVGSLNRVDRRLGLNASRLIRDQGIENVTPEVIAAARRFAPDYVRQIERNLGDASPEMQAARREGFFGDDRQNLREIREQIDRVQTNIRFEINVDQSQLASDVEAILRRTLPEFRANLRAYIETQLREIQAGRQIRNNLS